MRPHPTTTAGRPDGSAARQSTDSTARRWLLVLFVIVATVFCVIPLVNHVLKMRDFTAQQTALAAGRRVTGPAPKPGTKDYPLWYETGQTVLHGSSPYRVDRNGEFPFMYPPAAAGLFAAVSGAGRLPLMAFMLAVNTATWLVAIFGPVYLLTGRVRGQNPLLYLIPSVVVVVNIWCTYLEGQPAFFLSACLVGMLCCLRQRVSWGAGLLLALAGGFKGFPILAVPYLVWRRQWRALGYTVLFLFLLTIALPACFRGWGGAVADARQWAVGMPSNYTPTIIGQRAARSYTWQNGSLVSVANRWLRPVVADSDDNVPPLKTNVAKLSFATVNKILPVVAGLIGLGYLLVLPRRRDRRTRFTDAAEGSMLLVLIVLVSPLSFTYNNTWLMCPIATGLYFILSVATTSAQRRTAAVWLTVACGLLVFSVGGPFRAYRAVGNTFVADVELLLLLAWTLLKQRRPSFASVAEPAVAPATYGTAAVPV